MTTLIQEVKKRRRLTLVLVALVAIVAIATPALAEYNFYGSVRVKTFYVDNDKNTADKQDFTLDLQRTPALAPRFKPASSVVRSNWVLKPKREGSIPALLLVLTSSTPAPCWSVRLTPPTSQGSLALCAVHFLSLPSDPAVTSNALAIRIVFPLIGVTPVSFNRPGLPATLGKLKVPRNSPGHFFRKELESLEPFFQL